MPTDPQMNGNGAENYLRDIGELRESVADITAIVYKTAAAAERAYEVADMARETAHQLKESIANHSSRMKAVEGSMRENSRAVGDAHAILIKIEMTLNDLSRRTGKWPSDPEDDGTGLAGKVARIGRHMGLDDAFNRSSYLSLEEAAHKSREIGERELMERLHKKRGPMYEQYDKTTVKGLEIERARQEAELVENESPNIRYVPTVEQKPKSSLRPAVDAFKSLPRWIQITLVTVTSLVSIGITVWQSIQAARGH